MIGLAFYFFIVGTSIHLKLHVWLAFQFYWTVLGLTSSLWKAGMMSY